MPSNRATAALLIAVTLAWNVSAVATALHFSGVSHARDATGRVVHLGCAGHPQPVHLHHGEAGDDDGSARWTTETSSPHGPEPCLHLAAAHHTTGVPLPPPTGAGADSNAAPGAARSVSPPVVPIDLLHVAPKLPPPAAALG